MITMKYNYIERARKRLARNGSNVGDSYEINTSAFIQTMFSDSPTFRVADVRSFQFPDIKKIDIRVVEMERMGSLRQILFRPYEGLNTGAYVDFDGDTWLLTDSWGSIETMQQSSLAQKCNHILTWSTSENWLNADGSLDESKINRMICIASQSPLGSKSNQGKLEIEFNKYDVKLPFGQMYIFLEKNDITTTIGINDRFFLGSNVYEVVGVDDNTLVNLDGYGIIQITARVTTRQNLDDLNNGIAFNRYGSVNSNPINTFADKEEKGSGGVIW